MKGFRAAVALAFLLGFQATGAARQASVALSPRNASYTLEAQLDRQAHTIAGSGRLVWRNITKSPAADLRFHLYWNAWRNTASSWMREELLVRPGIARRPPEDWARIDLTRLAIGEASLLSRARFIAPDDGNADDRTVLQVPLDKPVAPGETIAVDFAWTSHVPRTFARTGVIGNYYFVGQWFPKIGVFQDDGTWNCHQFHAATEFFSDFGTYDVRLDVPARWIVGATGRMAEPALTAEDADHTDYHFVADDVHDFAWTTSPDFLDKHETFESPGLPSVDMRLLLQPEHDAQAERHFEATRIALKDYGTWFGAYPYGNITIVDPVAIFNEPAQGASTGGMEYPTLFTAGTHWFAPVQGLSPESVTIHEAGHQFWYGIVATNEFENAWMDEGFNSYSQARAIDESLKWRFRTVDRYFGGLAAWTVEDVPWMRDLDGSRLNTFRPVAAYQVPSTPTWQYWPGSAAPTTYGKTALWMATLEKMLGWPTMQKIMSTYFARGAFRHPTPQEFFAIANEVSGRDLTWFFDAVYRSAAVFDYGVAEVTGTPMRPRGIVGDGPAEEFSAGGGRIDSTVVVRRYGDGVFPVDVRVTFADGAATTEHWDGRDRWHAFTYRRAAAVHKVQIDPDHVLLLDVNYTNNSWSAQPLAAFTARKWSLRWLTWLEEVLMTYAFFS